MVSYCIQVPAWKLMSGWVDGTFPVFLGHGRRLRRILIVSGVQRRKVPGREWKDGMRYLSDWELCAGASSSAVALRVGAV